MNSKRDSVALAQYKGKTTFEQLEMAINGKNKLHRQASTLVFRADHIADERSKGLMADLAFKLHCQDIGKRFIELWRNARRSKNGQAFQTIALMAEKIIPSAPDYAFVAEIKRLIESGQLQALREWAGKKLPARLGNDFAKEIKNLIEVGELQALRTMIEKADPSAPYYALLVEIKQLVESIELQSIPPVNTAVKHFNESRKTPTIAATSYQQMKRVYAVFGLNPPKAKRGPKQSSRLKSESRNS